MPTRCVRSSARVRPDAVLHLAAESHVDRSIDGPDAFVQHQRRRDVHTAAGRTRALALARCPWRAAAFRFIHVSTDEVYGSLGADDAPFTEDTKYDPHSPYAASKAASDHLARAWHDTYGLPVIVTNCSNNYGPYQFPEKLIPVIVLKALAAEPIPVYGAGDNVRDWLYVEDHVRALVRVLKAGAPGRTYNIGGNNEMRNIDLVRRVCALLGRDRCPPNDGRPYGELITFVTDRPGPRQALRDRCDAHRGRTRLDARPPIPQARSAPRFAGTWRTATGGSVSCGASTAWSASVSAPLADSEEGS